MQAVGGKQCRDRERWRYAGENDSILDLIGYKYTYKKDRGLIQVDQKIQII